MPKIIIHEQAQGDVEAESAFLANDSADLAIRFLNEFDRAVKRLVQFPRLGRAWPAENTKMQGLRRFTMTSFPVSIFYRPTEEGIEIVRVLHHSRDLPPDFQDF